MRCSRSLKWVVGLTCLFMLGSMGALAQEEAPKQPPERKAAPPNGGKSAKGVKPGNGEKPAVGEKGAPDREGIAPDKAAAKHKDGVGLELSADAQSGLSVARIEENSLAARSGFKANDRIISINGRAVADARQFNGMLGSLAGYRVPVIIERDGRRYTVTMNMPQQQQGAGGWLGVYLAEAQEGAEPPKGVVVTQVFPASPAARAGFSPGDVVTQINETKVADPQEFVAVIEEMPPQTKAKFTVMRDNKPVELTATLGTNQFVYRGQGGQRYQEGGDDQFSYWDDVPPHAMQLEYDRRMMEQHERMEKMLLELKEEVRQLREELQKK